MKGNKTVRAGSVAYSLLVLLAGCVAPVRVAAVESAAPAVAEKAPIIEKTPESSPAATPAPEYVEQGDLTAIASHGRLRVAIPVQSERDVYLPRRGFPNESERDVLSSFAEQNKLEVVWVPIENREQLIPALLEGRVDVIAARMTVTDDRKALIAFTVPIGHVREQVIGRKGDQIKNLKSLYGRRFHIRKSSAFWGTLEGLRKKHPQIHLVEAPATMLTEDIMDEVAAGRFDLTVADSDLAETVLSYRTDLSGGIELGGERPIAWAVRPTSTLLKASLDKFLSEEQISRRRPPMYKTDWEGIQKRKVLRVLTRNNATTYFLWRGELLGFEYELVRRFAQAHGLRLEVLVPQNRDDLLIWLKEGRGDLVAASMTITQDRAGQGFTFSRPYNQVSELVVVRSRETPPRTPAELAGRTVVVRKSSSYWETLVALQKSGIALKLVAAPEEMETEEIIDRVGKGEYDVTIADSHILDVELTWREDVQSAFPITGAAGHGWVVRSEDRSLLKAINAYFEKEYKGTFYNLTYQKYFRNQKSMRKHLSGRADRDGSDICAYDSIVKKYCQKYDMDWRLVVAQMFQESRFDPDARSFAGAVGLMQVLPRTARQYGFEDLTKPDTCIHAGVKYMDWLLGRLDPEIADTERLWFAMASYNAGLGHVLDARQLARKKGLDPNRWFDNVEKAMLLLAKAEYAREARYGYCRGSEPVKYVREIASRYSAYVRTHPEGG